MEELNGKQSLAACITSWFVLTDEQAMRRVKQEDDPHAFAQLVRRWEGPIQRLCARMLGDSHRAEDLAQEAFTRLFRKRNDYEPRSKFSTFLWRIALNLCYDELRRIRRRPESPLDEADCDSSASAPSSLAESAPDQQLVAREQGQLVREAIQQLGETYRSVVVLRHFEGLKFREIAEVLGIPEGTVKSRMAEALNQLHACLAGSTADPNSDLCNPQTHRTDKALVL